MKKRLTCVILALVMAMSLLPAGVMAKSSAVKGTVSYQSGHDNNYVDHTVPYTYSDAFFTGNGAVYRGDLASMSLAMSMAAGGSTQASSCNEKSKNFEKLMKETGFTAFGENDWSNKRPALDSVGVTAASKRISANGATYTLIAVGVRGWGYGAEWGGNFNIGASGDHASFAAARDEVLSFIKSYIADNSITGRIKLWISGYSRAAAAANMAAGYIDDGYALGKVSLAHKDMYCYCFEPPMGAVSGDNLSAAKYNNIQNVMNYNDVVALAAPSGWGFGRYGVDHVLPTKGCANYGTYKAAMLKKFASLQNTGLYLVDCFREYRLGLLGVVPVYGSKMTQGQFLRSVVNAMSADLTREDYAAELQPILENLLSDVFGVDSFTGQDAYAAFLTLLAQNSSKLLAVMTPAGALKYGTTPARLLQSFILQALKSAGVTLYDPLEVQTAAVKLAALGTSFALKHPDLAATLLPNILGIASAHYPELCYAWVTTVPDSYMRGAAMKY
jgi:hypothetical protein